MNTEKMNATPVVAGELGENRNSTERIVGFLFAEDPVVIARHFTGLVVTRQLDMTRTLDRNNLRTAYTYYGSSQSRE